MIWKVINGFPKRSDLIYKVQELLGRGANLGKEAIVVVKEEDQVPSSSIGPLEVMERYILR